jgi:hypothetical protein
LPGGPAGPFTFKAVQPGDAYPTFGGHDYAPDGYTVPGDFKRHRPGGFVWLDAPRVPVGDKAATADEEFIVFVRGNLGTCWCRFSIRQSWSEAGGVKGPGLALTDSHACRLFKSAR